MVLGLRKCTDRTENGEELMRVQPGVAIVISNCSPESPGTLYISTKKVMWLSVVDRAKGYAVDFLSLSLHAVSRDPEAYASSCIYIQIQTEDDENDSGSESNEVLDLSKVKELRLVPSDPSQLDTLFQVFCKCAELNPELVEDYDEEVHNWIFSIDQIRGDAGEEEEPEWHFSHNPISSIGHSNGVNDVARRVLELQINDQWFEYPEEMEREGQNGHH